MIGVELDDLPERASTRRPKLPQPPRQTERRQVSCRVQAADHGPIIGGSPPWTSPQLGTRSLWQFFGRGDFQRQATYGDVVSVPGRRDFIVL